MFRSNKLIISLSQPLITTRARNLTEFLSIMPAKRKVGKAVGPSKSAKRKCQKRSVLHDENTSDHCSERVVESKQVLLKEMTAIGKE